EIVPVGDYTHSVTYGIPLNTREIRGTANGGGEGLDRSGTRTFYISPGTSTSSDGETRLGVDGFYYPGYKGPNPRDGREHIYVFTLYAVNEKLQLPAGATSDQVERAMNPPGRESLIIGQTSLRGAFGYSAGTLSEVTPPRTN